MEEVILTGEFMWTKVSILRLAKRVTTPWLIVILDTAG